MISVACSIVVTALAVKRFLIDSTRRSDAADIHPVAVKNWDRFSVGGHRMGPPDAAVTIEEFADFECPVCRDFTLSALRGVRVRYPKAVAVVFRHWPLPYHRFAYLAARAAECAADQGRFEAYHDLLYEKQDSLGVKSFVAFARDAAVPNIDAFAKCASVRTPNAIIDHDKGDAIAIGGRGTPTLVLNGKRLTGAPDSEHFDALVRKMIPKAR